MKTNLRFSILTTSIVLLIGSPSLVAQAQMFDENREGLILGGGAGFSAIVVGDNKSDIGFTGSGLTTNGKIGYGISNQLAIYVSSSIHNFTPGLGLMYFPDQYSDYYLNGTLGFRSAAGISNLAISGGVGYEFHDHIMFELTMGYNQFSYPETSITYTTTNYYGYEVPTGTETSTTRNKINIITISFTLNYYFY